MPSAPPHFILYGAHGCSLCEQLRAQLESLRGEIHFSWKGIDIAEIPDLESAYRSEIPVLLIDGRKAVKYRISTEALRRKLLRAAGREHAGVAWLR